MSRDPAIGLGRLRPTVRRVAIVAAFVAFQTTFGLTAGLAVAIISFGIRDVRTALRLRKVDPNRVRGRVCSWFYLAYACWCVVVVVMLCFFAIRLSDDDRRKQPSAPNLFSNETTVCAMILLACTIIGMSASCIGVGLAMRHRVQVWVDPRFRLYSTTGWPPILSDSANRARFFPLVIWVIAGLFLSMGLIFSIVFVVSWQASEPFGIIRLTFFAVNLILTILVAWFVFAPSWRARVTGVVALHPWQCYPESLPILS